MKRWKNLLFVFVILCIITSCNTKETIQNETSIIKDSEMDEKADGAESAINGTSNIRTYGINDETKIQIKQGEVVGSIENGIYQYLGIPYANAKELFTVAKEPNNFDGIFAANKYGSISYQASILGIPADDGGFETSSNPLNLNIWTPKSDDKKRPVMVWFHGGGFSTGTANYENYSGLNLAKQGDIVFVGVNHRLNIYGHLNLEDYGDKYKFSANAGIMDLIDSLKWIKENIDKFGGDPNNVTIFGESGGGAKVLALMSSPYAKGLFKRGIIESGATEEMGVYFEKNDVSKELTNIIVERLGLTKDTIDEINNKTDVELQDAAIYAQELIANKYKIPASLKNGYSMAWEPVVDGDFLPTDPVLDKGFAKGAEEYGMLIGSNLNEWSIYAENLQYKNATKEQKELYKKAYPNENENDVQYVDTLIRLPMLKIMSHRTDIGGEKVYAYVFTHKEGALGSYHGAELPYVFNNTPNDEKLGKLMSDAWINYARYGVPSIEGVETWEAYDRENMATMIIDNNPYLAHNHDKELMATLEPDYKY